MGIFGEDLLDAPPEEGQGVLEEGLTSPDEGQLDDQPESEEPALTPEEEEERMKEDLVRAKFNSKDDIVKAYRELERKLGSRDDEKEGLKRQLELAAQYIQTLAAGRQQAQEAPEAPKEPEDPAAWLEQFYEHGPQAVDARVQAKLAEFEQRLQQRLEPVQQHLTQEYYNQQAMALAGKYSDFKELAPTMSVIYEKYPQLAGMPNGMELAYQMAKGLKQTSPSPDPAKQAARMPGSAGARTGKAKTPEDSIRESIFGSPGTTQGIFG